MKSIRNLIVLLLLVGAVVLALSSMPGPLPAPLAARSGPPLTSAKVWGYQLQGARPEFISRDIDLVVIDHAHEQGANDLLTQQDVEAFRQRQGGAPRIVLAYMSIGEAERYRFYWQKWWASKASLGFAKPTWLARENKEWRGNYLVRFWESGWQKIIFNPAPSQLDVLKRRWLGKPEAYLDMVMEAGFDGVYLDRVDVFGEWEKSHKTAEAEMRQFVARLSAYAKTRKPGFLIVPQNGEELLADKAYRDAVDGIAKEDLLFGVTAAEKPNSREETRRSTELLRKMQADGKPVFVVEYLKDAAKRAEAQARTRELGFVVTFADRELNGPPESVVTEPQAPAAPAAATPKTQK